VRRARAREFASSATRIILLAVLPAVFGLDFSSWTPGDWGQVLSALFTAVAALAAWATVVRAGRDRRRSSWPDLHVEVIVDIPGNEVRLTIVNYGGPAREVRVWGVVGDFGFGGNTEPSTFWQPGERRTFHLHVPPEAMPEESAIFVEGRDMAKRHLFITTYGGATYRWPLRKAKKLSAAKEWEQLFPNSPGPHEVKYKMVRVELIEREVGGRVSATRGRAES
jgi:hypothetical protein